MNTPFVDMEFGIPDAVLRTIRSVSALTVETPEDGPAPVLTTTLIYWYDGVRCIGVCVRLAGAPVASLKQLGGKLIVRACRAGKAVEEWEFDEFDSSSAGMALYGAVQEAVGA